MDRKNVMEEVGNLIDELLVAIEIDLNEENELAIYNKISHLSPDPEWSDYVFHSDEFYREDGTLDIDAVVEKIFSYKPIQL